MALTVGTDTYATVATIQAYLDLRGYSVTIAEDDVLRAMDYIESQTWATDQVDEDSALFWGDDPPDDVVAALCHAARLEAGSTGILMPDSQKLKKRLKIDVIDIEYDTGGTSSQPIIKRLLGNYIQASGTMALGLT